MTNQDFGYKPQKITKQESFLSWKMLFYLLISALALAAYVNSFSKQSYILVPAAHATSQQVVYDEELLSSQK